MVAPLQNTDMQPEVIATQARGQNGTNFAGTISPLITILEAYRIEAWQARISGRNPRDVKWRENLDLYWNRFDFSKKARWQSTAILPEVPQFVDKFAAAMTEALVASQNGNGEFFTVEDPADAEGDITKAIKAMLKVWLDEVAVTPNGHPLSFLAVFPDFVKLGALMNMAAIVLWKERPDGTGYVSVEPLDPRALWFDHTGRGLYRIRRIEVDKSEMLRLARQTNKRGKKIYNLQQIENLASYLRVEMQEEQRRLTGSGVEQTSWRKPLTLDEYLCTIVDTDGQVLATNSLVIVANERFIIRGPEANPFWHKRDWIVSTPLITVPLAPYGRSYMENMGSMARLFNDLTNLIMDAVYTSALKAFAINPSLLEDPTQADEGLSPNVTYRLQDGSDPKMFMNEIELGSIPPDVFQVWQALKSELQTAAGFNDISAGNMAPKGRTSASEIVTADTNSTAQQRDIARTIEQRFIEPVLDLVWKTGLQHMKKNDPKLIAAVGNEQLYQALWMRRKELAGRSLTFHVRGISEMILKQQKLKALLQTVGIIAQNQNLTQAFMQKVDPGKLIDLILSLQEIDISKLGLTPREQMMKQISQQGEAIAGPMGQPAPQPGGGGGPINGPRPQTQTAGQTGAGRVPQSAPAQGANPPQAAQDMLAKLATGGQ
jgi:hypothetical protein